MKSNAIPIPKSSMARTRIGSENTIHYSEEDALLIMDDQDYAFYCRLVVGLNQKLSLIQDVTLRYQNQAILDHIMDSRQEREVPPTTNQKSSNDILMADKFAVKSSQQVFDVVRMTAAAQIEYNELIFELDLE